MLKVPAMCVTVHILPALHPEVHIDWLYERGQENIHFPCSADHEQDWQPYPVDPYPCYMCDHTYMFRWAFPCTCCNYTYPLVGALKMSLLYFSYPADHVPNWQPRILLAMVEARSVLKTQTHRHTDTQTHRHTDTPTHRHTDTQTHAVY